MKTCYTLQEPNNKVFSFLHIIGSDRYKEIVLVKLQLQYPGTKDIASADSVRRNGFQSQKGDFQNFPHFAPLSKFVLLKAHSDLVRTGLKFSGLSFFWALNNWQSSLTGFDFSHIFTVNMSIF